MGVYLGDTISPTALYFDTVSEVQIHSAAFFWGGEGYDCDSNMAGSGRSYSALLILRGYHATTFVSGEGCKGVLQIDIIERI